MFAQFVFAAAIAPSITSLPAQDYGGPRFAFVTGGDGLFWEVAGAGARAAAAEFGVDVDLVRHEGRALDQMQRLEDLMLRGVDGIAVAVINGKNMSSFLDDVADKTHLITHDSDAPASKRRCFVGVDNYMCGRACGDLLREALPDGGKVALFVGRLEQENAQLRRQGVIDALLRRSVDSTRRDATDATPRGNGFTIVTTRADGFNASRAKVNAEDLLVAHPDLAGMVGLSAYHAPACIAALRSLDMLGEVEICSFDERFATLDEIAEGTVLGSVCPDPFQYGFQSVRILNGLHAGDESVLPETGTLAVEPTVVTRANLEEFRAKLERDLAGGQRGASGVNTPAADEGPPGVLPLVLSLGHAFAFAVEMGIATALEEAEVRARLLEEAATGDEAALFHAVEGANPERLRFDPDDLYLDVLRRIIESGPPLDAPLSVDSDPSRAIGGEMEEQTIGAAALEMAIELGHTEAAAVLLDAGATITRVAAHEVFSSNDTDLALRLIAAGFDFDAPLGPEYGPERALFQAAGAGNAVLVEALLEAGANPNLLHEGSVSPLEEALRRSEDRPPAFLGGLPDHINSGIARDRERRSRNYAETVSVLLAHGADPRRPAPVLPDGLLEAFEDLRRTLASGDVHQLLNEHVDPQTLERLLEAADVDDVDAFVASAFHRSVMRPLLAYFLAILRDADSRRDLWTADLPVAGAPRLRVRETDNGWLTPNAFHRFETRGAYRVDITLPAGLAGAARAASLASMVSELEAIASVREVTVGSYVPYLDPILPSQQLVVPGGDADPVDVAIVDVSTKYFERLSMAFGTGSAFPAPSDAPGLVVCADVHGNTLYTEEIGREVTVGGEPFRYAGWLGDFDSTSWSRDPRYYAGRPDEPRPPIVFRDIAQSNASAVGLIVDAVEDIDSALIAAAIATAIPGAEVANWRSLESEVHEFAYPDGQWSEASKNSESALLLADGSQSRGTRGLVLTKVDRAWKLTLPDRDRLLAWLPVLQLARVPSESAEVPFEVIARTAGFLIAAGDHDAAAEILAAFLGSEGATDRVEPIDLYMGHLQLGNAQMSRGQFEEARATFLRAIEAGREARQFDGVEFLARNSLVTLAGLAGDAEAARRSESALIDSIDRGIEALDDLDDRGTISRVLGTLVEVQINLANWQVAGGRFEEARVTIDSVRDAVKRAGGAASASLRSLRLLEANHALFSGRTKEARIFLDDLVERAVTRPWERDRLHALALANLGLLDELDGELESALVRRRQAARRIEALAGGNAADLGLALTLEGVAALRAGALDDGRGALSRGAELLDDAGSNAAWIPFVALGTIETLTGDLDRAHGAFGRAEERVRAAFGTEHRHFANYLASRALLDLADGDTDAALARLKRAIAIVESERGQFKNDADRRDYLRLVADLYSALTWINLERGEVERAFEAVERGKAKSFVELLAADEQSGTDERERHLLAQVAASEAGQRLLDASQAGDSNPGASRRFRATAEALSAQVDRRGELAAKRVELLRQLRTLNPSVASAVLVEPVSEGRVRAALASDEILVEFFELEPPGQQPGSGERALMAFIASATRIEVREVAKSSAEVFTAVDKAINGMLRSDRRRGGFEILGQAANTAPRSVEDESRRLFDLVVRPLEDLLVQPRITVVPVGALHYLPFAALHDGDGWLGERFELATVPSAEVLVRLRERAAAEGDGLLALADPDGYLGRLTGARQEVEEIARLFDRATVRPGVEATEASLRHVESSPRVLHIAGHGIFDGEHPELSHLALAPGGRDDGRMEVHEVYGLPLEDTELVVLSACSTGVGALSGGEEVVGLTRGFLVAGSRTVVSSLWDVSDSATRALMTRFYTELVAGVPPADALRRAQAALRADPATASPFYWGAFQISGLGW